MEKDGTNESIIYRYDTVGVLISLVHIFNDGRGIDNEQFVYGDNGLICKSENDRYIYDYEYDIPGNLKKLYYTHKLKTKPWIGFYEYEYKDKQRIIQKHYMGNGKLDWEHKFVYDDSGRRIAVLRNNEYFGYRDYDEMGLLKKFYNKDGSVSFFHWENKFSSYDWNMYFGF
jgi:hypothetical protein